MKFLHLSDLHLGKLLVRCPLIENGDQHFLLQNILKVVDEQGVDAVVISGDVYDRGVPAKEAVTLLSRFLTELALVRNLPVLLIAGNHDGAERLGFGAELLRNLNVHIAGALTEELQCVTLRDEQGDEACFWLLPYVEPLKVRTLYGLSNEEVPDTEAAVREVLSRQRVDFTKRNVLLAHQYVTAGGEKPEEGCSETSLGGSGSVDYRVFDGFDYVALGHIHNAQSVGRSGVRYAGSPMPYHFSELGQKKGALLVNLGAKGEEAGLELFPLPLLHPLRSVKGRFADILSAEKEITERNEYISVVLTDSETVRDGGEQLRSLIESHGSRLLNLAFEPETREFEAEALRSDAREQSMEELFGEFFTIQMDRAMNEQEAVLIRFLCGKILNDADETDEELTEALIRLAVEQEESV